MIEGDKYPTISVLSPIIVKKMLIEGILNRFKYIWDDKDLLLTSFLDPKTKQMKPFSERLQNRILEHAKMIVSATQVPNVPNSHTEINVTPSQPNAESISIESILGSTNYNNIENFDEVEQWKIEETLCWKGNTSNYFLNHKRYKKIPSLYRIHCCNQAASTSVERLWSSAGGIITRRRSRMSPVEK